MDEKRFFLLTFDLEEFDLPREYNLHINDNEMYNISYEGAKTILEILKKLDIKATFFVTGKFALKYSKMVLDIYKNGHEIASHSLSHSQDYNLKKNIMKGKEILKNITDDEILGFRSPRLEKPSFKVLKELDFKYDSSLHPTYIIGRYNNLKKTRKIHKKDDILEVPISVTHFLRTPFSWIWFRNIGLNYTKICTSLCIYDSGFVNLYFHPWEFVDIKKYKLPFFIQNKTGNWMNKNFQKYIKWCLSKNIKFITIKSFLESF